MGLMNECTYCKSNGHNMDSKLGVDQIVDELVDAIQVGEKIAAAVADGVQVTDALVLWSEYPRLKELYEDAPEAWAQLKDLDGDEAQDAAQQVADRVGMPRSEVTKKIVASLSLLARTYRYVTYTMDEGKALLEDWKLTLGIA